MATMSNLEQFMSGSFHQDWMIESANPEEIIAIYVKRKPKETVEQTLSELRELLVDGKSEKELENYLFNNLGCYYDPLADGQSVSEWLKSVAHQLESLLKSNF